jgi:alkanesulfonate monooxygenase SsuD/methylene tetrahydromethanopterin reductase-like flavin-dependent oxidoreductase (luciferase family)
MAEGMMAGATARWSDFLAMAKAAEDLAFDSLWVFDHFLMRWGDGSGRTEGCWECWSLLSALAAVTNRITIGSWVVGTGFRNPALLAKMADTVDEISGGRLVLGLGAGYNETEYRAFGFPHDHRTSRFEEALAIIHPLLRDGRVDFAGKYYEARDCELRPRGPRTRGPPLLLGTSGPRGLRLAARYADVWNAAWTNLDDCIAHRPAVDAACADVGRDPATLVRSAGLQVELPGASPYPPGYTNWGTPLTGSAEELAEQFRAFAREGYTQLQLWVNPTTVAGIERAAEVLTLLDRGR